MFHEIFLAPFTQTKKFMSPDVDLLPFVSGSTHVVMTPLWTPGRCVVLAAPAIVVAAANTTIAAIASRFVDGDFIPRLLPGSPRAEGPLLGSASAKLVGLLRSTL